VATWIPDGRACSIRDDEVEPLRILPEGLEGVRGPGEARHLEAEAFQRFRGRKSGLFIIEIQDMPPGPRYSGRLRAAPLERIFDPFHDKDPGKGTAGPSVVQALVQGRRRDHGEPANRSTPSSVLSAARGPGVAPVTAPIPGAGRHYPVSR